MDNPDATMEGPEAGSCGGLTAIAFENNLKNKRCWRLVFLLVVIASPKWEMVRSRTPKFLL